MTEFKIGTVEGQITGIRTMASSPAFANRTRFRFIFLSASMYYMNEPSSKPIKVGDKDKVIVIDIDEYYQEGQPGPCGS